MKNALPKFGKLIYRRFFLLAVSVIVMGAIAAQTAVAKPNCPGHPSCKNDDNNPVNKFDVEIFDDSTTLIGDGTGWIDDSGNSQILFQYYWEDGSSGDLINMDFLHAQFTDGSKCFSSPVEIHQAILGKTRRGNAQAQFWFVGSTTDESKNIMYRFILEGSFDSPNDWPPIHPGTNSMFLTKWSIGVENEGKKIKDISCIGKGEVDPLTPFVVDVMTVGS